MYEEKRDNPVAWNTLAVTIGDSETNMQHECQGIPTCQLQRDTRCNPHLHCDRQDRLCETSALQQHRAPLDFILFSFAYIGIGGGIFYRYGYYALPKNADNWAFKWGFSISF